MPVAALGVLIVFSLAAAHAPLAGAAGVPHPENALYGTEHVEHRVQSAVFDVVLMYVQQGSGVFDAMTPDAPQRTGDMHQFVLDAATLSYVADSSALHAVGEYEDGLERGDRSLERILADVRNNGGAWFEYLCLNPANGEREFKRVWLHEYDGYLFGSGYFLPDSAAQETVNRAVELYVAEGTGAFDIITPEEPVETAALYPFVMDAGDPELPAVAHGSFPDRVGRSAAAVIGSTSDRSFGEVMEDLSADGGTWVEYMFTNPDTGTEQLKRTWLYRHDGYIFASGYYLPDVRLQTVVGEVVRMYNLDGGDAAFGAVTPDEPAFASGSYAFVVDAESLRVEAHGAFPHLVGDASHHLDAADKPLREILAELAEYGEAWVMYVSENPGTRTDQLARAYLRMHDGHIFGAAYSLPDSRALSKVDEAIYTYRAAMDAAFADINAGSLNERNLFPAVTNATNVLAHGTLPDLAGYAMEYTRIYNVLGQTVVYATPLIQHMIAVLDADGRNYWYREVGLNPDLEQMRNNVGRSYGGLSFVSGYYVTEGDVQSRVDLAVFSYKENGRAAFDAMTPDGPVTGDEYYPFVLNATTLEVVAHGASPDAVGTIYDSVLNTGPRPLEEVLSEVAADGNAWVAHTAVNPATGGEQTKRSWLEARDGYIFGAGYYLADSNLKNVAAYTTIVYDHAIHLLPQRDRADPAHGGFIMDPITGLEFTTGRTSEQWEEITALVPAAEILRTLEREPGMWVTYMSVHPLTGNEEERRVWMMLHDGYVFGRGYYESTPLPATASD